MKRQSSNMCLNPAAILSERLKHFWTVRTNKCSTSSCVP